MMSKYGPTYFIKWLFNQDLQWLTADGRWLYIPGDDVEHNVSFPHAVNLLAFLNRTCQDCYEARFPYTEVSINDAMEWLADTPLYKAVYERVLSGV